MAWKNFIENILPRAIPARPEDKSRIMERLNYVGADKLTPTQMRKLRRQAAENFLGAASRRPNWPNRVEELWQESGDKRFTLN
ncbi:MAG: hypothetical protein V1928_01260 [Parcubacteria group bacterium]